MMSAAALRASQLKAPHQLVADVVARQSGKLAYTTNLVARNPAMFGPGIRRFQSPATSLWKNQMQQQSQHKLAAAEERWQLNFRRLKIRRMLELAALAAISRQYHHLCKTDMEQAPTLPTYWKDWEQRDWTDDLLATLGRTKVERVWVAAKRLVSLGMLVSPMAVLMPLSYVSSTAKDWCWDYALWGIEHAGPTAIKLIQWATTRQDLFSPEFCLHFGKLRDDTTGHAFRETMRILEEELGAHHGEILEMSPTPIGSGCIAQVYRGKLLQATKKHPVGTDIALKIQHPGIWHKVCVDFYILAKVAKFLEAIPKLNLRYLSLADTVRQFRDIMLPQLDLRLEAKHLHRFNQDFVNDESVNFPHPIDELTSSQVLIETFVNGTPILEYAKAPVETRRKVALIGLETTLKMIFINDFVHGDLHPGNILVSERANGEPRLNFLDCGLVVEVGPHQHVNMVKILGAFTRRNGRLAGQLMVDTASESQASEWDIETFVSGIEQMTVDDYNNNFIEKVGDYIADICFMACRHKVKLEATFVNAALAVEIMEGIAASLYPDMHVQPIALPLIVKAELMHRLPKFWND